jgi:hypothetical protein
MKLLVRGVLTQAESASILQSVNPSQSNVTILAKEEINRGRNVQSSYLSE